MKRRSLLLPAAAIAAATGVLYRRYRSRRPRPGAHYLAGAPLLIAHRGGSALAPENTMEAFRRAIDWWNADILEIDVQPTADGEAVVFHDSTLDRTTNGSGPVGDQTLEQLRSLDAGYRFTADGSTYPFRGRGVGIATLREVLEAFPATRINIEIKDGRAQRAVADAIRSTGARNRVLIAAGSRANRSLFDDSGLPVSAGEEELKPFVLQLAVGIPLYTPAVDALQIPDRWDGRQVLSPKLVKAAHQQNLAVHVWSVNDEGDMRSYLEWGVDGIITDRPDLLSRVLRDLFGRPVPPGPPPGEIEPSLEYLLRPDGVRSWTTDATLQT